MTLPPTDRGTVIPAYEFPCLLGSSPEHHPMPVFQLLRAAGETLAKSGIECASLEAEVLLRDVLRLTRAQLFADYGREVTGQERSKYLELVRRRLAGEPTAYITGHREFYGLDFEVDRRVLIPRPETELLVERAIRLGQGGARSFADIGTGSGAVAISLAVNLPQIRVFATDISPDALDVALVNCRKHGVENRVRLLQGDLLDPLPESVDVVLANLPYVRESDLGAVNTLGFEPVMALDGGRDGLDEVRRIAAHVSAKLSRGGSLLLEIGYGQEEEAVRLLRHRMPNAAIEVTPDLGGVPRLVTVALSG